MLTPAEIDLAKLNGWVLCDVYDEKSRRWVVQVLPTKDNPVQSVTALFTVLLTRGASGDALASKLVNITMASLAPKTKPKKAKKK